MSAFGPVSWPRRLETKHKYEREPNEFYDDAGDEKKVSRHEPNVNTAVIANRATSYLAQKQSFLSTRLLYPHIRNNLALMKRSGTNPARKQALAKLLNVQLDREGFFKD